MVKRLRGPQKAAILLLTLGEDGAAEVMKNLTEDEIREVSRYMTDFVQVTPQDLDRVANEFYLVAEKARILPGSPTTKTEYLRKILGKALGEDKADQVVGGLVKDRPKSRLEQLKWHDPKTIADFISEEHPQVIAVILSNLGDSQLAQSVMSELPGNMQMDVLTRFARIRDIPQEWLDEIESSLVEEMGSAELKDQPEEDAVGRVADVLEAADKPAEESLIRHLAERDPELAGKIRDRMFQFEDVIKIDNYGIQLILKAITGEDLVLALKLADESLQRHFIRNLSTESAQRVEEALQSLGALPIARVETAQKRIASVARSLIEKGEIFPLQRSKKPADS